LRFNARYRLNRGLSIALFGAHLVGAVFGEHFVDDPREVPTQGANRLVMLLSLAAGKYESLNTELKSSQKHLSEISRQHKDQTKKLEEMVSVDKKRTLSGYFHQFALLYSRTGQAGSEVATEQNYTKQYNELLTALKKELPNDNYIQHAEPLSLEGTRSGLVNSLESASTRIRAYLEQRYLK
jgi:predicted  nucleic acid-binding Zn-ribbon protein